MSDSTFSPLNRFALIRIDGKDAERFLQGQTSCDLVKLADQHWTLGACCTAKGRMVANFVIARHQQAFWLRLNADIAEGFIAHLSKYAVFFKAQMSLLSDWQVTGSLSSVSNQEGQIKKPQPQQWPLTAASDQQLQLRWPDGRIECWHDNTSSESGPTLDQAWADADIEQGLAWVSQATLEQWIPQNIDWHLHGGVSFNKGCYTGQEIVARLQYLGKAKKTLQRISTERAEEVELMSKVSSADGKNLGQVISWQMRENGATGLALLDSNAAEAIELTTADGPLAAKAQALLYSAEDE